MMLDELLAVWSDVKKFREDKSLYDAMFATKKPRTPTKKSKLAQAATAASCLWRDMAALSPYAFKDEE